MPEAPREDLLQVVDDVLCVIAGVWIEAFPLLLD